jgi:phospholipase C
VGRAQATDHAAEARHRSRDVVVHDTEIGLRATVVDGMPALRLDVGLPSRQFSLHSRGVVEAMLSKAWSAIGWTGAAIAAAIASTALVVPGAEAALVGTAFDGVVATLAGLLVSDIPVFDARFVIYLVLRTSFDGTSLAAQPPTFDVIVQPYVGLDPDVGTLEKAVVGAMLGALQQFALTINGGLEYFASLAGESTIENLREQLHTYATALVGYLFGDPTKDVQPQPPQLSVTVPGDHPPYLELTADPPPTPIPGGPGKLSKIKNIVVLMMENRSFDHMVGYLSLPPPAGRGRTDVDGLTGTESNPDVDGRRVPVSPITNPYFAFDPNHDFLHVMQQRGDGRTQTALDPVYTDPQLPPGETPPKSPPPTYPTFKVPLDGGFVIDFDNKLRGDPRVAASDVMTTAREVMGYHLADHVPMYDFFATQFGLSNYWFAAYPGDTWPNRIVTLTGTLAKQADGTLLTHVPGLSTFVPLQTRTIFDYLTNASVSWRYFEHDLCTLRLFAKYTWDTEHVVQIDDALNGFFALAAKGELPSVVFIDPDLGDLPPGNDDHPPSSVSPGQALVKRVYDALATSPQWKDTLFIVTYDENGGIFDHVYPPADLDPNQALLQFRDVAPDFVTLPVTYRGFRVPAFVISPYIPAATALPAKPYPGPTNVYDHCTILKTIVQRFMPNAPPPLGARVEKALSLESWLTIPADQPRAAPPSPSTPVTTADDVQVKPAPYDPNDGRALLSALRYRYWPR